MEQISTYVPGILLAYSAFLLAVLSPGPNVLAIMGTSMSIGRTSGVALAFGVSVGSLTWACLTIIGLSALLAAYASALTVIKVAGGLYLLWLAFKSFRAAKSSQDAVARELEGRQRSPIGYMARGYLIQLSNPKAAMAWIAIISLSLQDGAPVWVGAIIAAGTFMLSISIHLFYALVFSSAVMIRAYGRARRGIQTLLGCFFAFAGLKLLASRS